jgi:transposase
MAGRKQNCRGCEESAAKIAALEMRLQELEEKLAKAEKNSSNSSKPPSSDIVNPNKAGAKTSKNAGKKRKQGGQPGHERHERDPYPEDQIDTFWELRFPDCPCCGGKLEDDPLLDPKKLQQVEFLGIPTQVEEYHRVGQRCTECDKIHFVPWPEDLAKAGLVGPRLTAFIGFLKGACHLSFSSIRKFLRDVVKVTISRGQLRKLISKVSDSLAAPHEELLRLLPHQEYLNVDETGHKDNGQRMWTWCFRAAMFTLFKISPSRGSQVLLEALGEEFDGTIGCDYFSAYRKYMRLNENVTVQFCLAHLIRDVKFLVEHPNSKNRAYGRRVLLALQSLFDVIHRREAMTEAGFSRRLQSVAQALEHQTTYRVPQAKESQNLAERFRRHGASYLRFITTPGIEPTNNLAEQAIRFVVIDRKITQGSRSESGQKWLERIWTAAATCSQTGRSVFEFITDAVIANFQGTPTPSLVPDTS